jgi:hypothetical protein
MVSHKITDRRWEINWFLSHKSSMNVISQVVGLLINSRNELTNLFGQLVSPICRRLRRVLNGYLKEHFAAFIKLQHQADEIARG